MAAFNALGTWGAIFLLHQFRGLQVSFGLQGSREPRRVVQWASKVVINFNPQGSREPRRLWKGWPRNLRNFNPQGSREPRPSVSTVGIAR